MKRFYTTVSTSSDALGWAVLLDDKPVKTPLGKQLRAPTEGIANLMVQEWSAQEDEIEPESMPITQIITTAIDRVTAERDEIERQTLAYIDTDMICYRAQQPESYVKRQADAWDKWVEWYNQQSGDVLLTTTALSALKQPHTCHEHAVKCVKSMDLWHFTVFQILVSITGSFILSLAFMDKYFDEEELFQLSHVEDLLRSEIYNEDFYGIAPTQERKWNVTKRDFKAIRSILGAL